MPGRHIHHRQAPPAQALATGGGGRSKGLDGEADSGLVPLTTLTPAGGPGLGKGDCAGVFHLGARPGSETPTQGPPTHLREPTWDDCQQLLQILFTTEERERILLEARKNVLGDNGAPTQLENLINEAFPLNRPQWDYNTAEGRERLLVYRRTLVAGLKGAARRPTNLAKVREVLQGPVEPPSVFLERLMEAYRRYTPFDPSSEGQQAAVAMAFIGQSAPDIKKKLQRLEGLQDFSLQDLVKEAEKVYHKRETEEERQEREKKETEERERRRDKRQEKNLTRILATVVSDKRFTDKQKGTLSNRARPTPRDKRPPLDRDQCAYCKEKGHWARECPRKKKNDKKARVLSLDD
ncbi:uncharacterized protein LOC134376272 [Cynocephalus volans]|uniref:uncharacterized protein LOC134376272 n=1 Tax=Cynocephalus volans TaxID=110931 RepID=UPI002FCA5D69